MTPEEFNGEFKKIEAMIGYSCPAPIKISIWAACKDRSVEHLRMNLKIYKFCWSEDANIKELKKRHQNS